MSETSICNAPMDPPSWEFSRNSGEGFVMIGTAINHGADVSRLLQQYFHRLDSPSPPYIYNIGYLLKYEWYDMYLFSSRISLLWREKYALSLCWEPTQNASQPRIFEQILRCPSNHRHFRRRTKYHLRGFPRPTNPVFPFSHPVQLEDIQLIDKNGSL